jgi:hypothetical protein
VKIPRTIAASVLATAGLLALAACANASGIDKGPYLQNPTTTTIVVCWVSDADTTGTVEYSKKGDPTAETKTAKDTTPTRYHKVKITGLSPYTRYTYKVTCDSRMGTGSFITAAKPDQPFKFIAYGDTRSQANKHAEVLRRMMMFEPDFVLQSGDLVANGSNEAQWDVFWETAAPLVKDTPYFPALGNHEGKGAPYFRYFDVPQEYSFDYGNTHFVALDTNRPASEHAAQEAWLKKDLAAHQKATWRVVYFHHTPYTCVSIPSRREDAVRLRERLEPIFQAEKVQLVISGHDHCYQHHLANGIHYIVSGGGGAPLYEVNPDTPFVKVAKSVHHDCEIKVNGKTMSFRAIEPDGKVIDSFELHVGQ